MDNFLGRIVFFFTAIAISGCGLSSGVLNKSVEKSTDRFHVWGKVAEKESDAIIELLRAEIALKAINSCQEFKIPKGSYKFTGQDVATMMLAHEFGCSARKWSDAMDTLARGGKSVFEPFSRKTPMPQGVIRETLEGLVGIAKTPFAMEAAHAYALGKFLSGFSDRDTVKIDSGGGNVDYSSVLNETKIGDGSDGNTISNDIGKTGQDNSDGDECDSGECGEDESSLDISDSSISEICSSKEFCDSSGECFINSAMQCSCLSYDAGDCTK